MTLRRALGAALLLVALTPAAARADGMIIPFVGWNFGGDSGKDFSNAVDADQLNWGVSFTWMGGGVFGVETDIGYSPDFFGKTDIGGSSVLSAMGNLLLGVPLGGQQGFGVRPYAVVGVGLIRSEVNTLRGPVRSRGEQDRVEFRRRPHGVLRLACRLPGRLALFPVIREA